MRVFTEEQFWAEALRCNPDADRRQFERAWRAAWFMGEALGLVIRVSETDKTGL